jgi:hypothetical protein
LSLINYDYVWQQQEYVHAQGIYLGLRDGRLTSKSTITQLEAIRSEQLIHWLHEDLSALESAWQ